MARPFQLPRVAGVARLSVAPATHLPCAETALLAGDCFRDLGALTPDDSYGDIPIVRFGFAWATPRLRFRPRAGVQPGPCDTLAIDEQEALEPPVRSRPLVTARAGARTPPTSTLAVQSRHPRADPARR